MDSKRAHALGNVLVERWCGMGRRHAAGGFAAPYGEGVLDPVDQELFHRSQERTVVLDVHEACAAESLDLGAPPGNSTTYSLTHRLSESFRMAFGRLQLDVDVFNLTNESSVRARRSCPGQLRIENHELRIVRFGTSMSSKAKASEGAILGHG